MWWYPYTLLLVTSKLLMVRALPTAASITIVDKPPTLARLTAQSVDRFSITNGIPNPYPDKPRVVFGKDGTFKLTVFADIHYGENPWDSWGPEQDINTSRLMRTMLAMERPDYVVINGDLITGENTFRENSTSLIDTIVQSLDEAKVPFSSTYGNHDNQVNVTHIEEIERETSITPFSYTRRSPPGVGGVGGPGNYWVPIYEKETDLSPALILWFFDSRGGVYTNGTSMPDWVDESVAAWIADETEAMNVAWGPPESRSALAFVHIPPHTIQAVQETLNSTVNPGLNADGLGRGSTQATNNPASAGSDRPFWDALNTHVKNLRAVVSGHDHGDEWCAREPTYDVIFCFSKHSGYGGYSGEGWGRGVRSFVFRSSLPSDGIDSYILLEDGTVRARVLLNHEYG
ncbi:Metallo-dependent phosphatase [Pisolithus croceorrhizus]|nr:Metallo-dependent phosphatase [Pisolithus croceorrhizus]KAI6124076.1 Metallo-dependent phosphatase [Pisolithus croceorrhizus]KAI6160717.1 Metallo-dependent phosphatase [Pisolithus thermaeus]